MPHDLGSTTSIAIVNDHLSLAGARVLDVGCGDMTFSKVLAEHGAEVLALDPDPVQATRNRAAAPTPRVTFKDAGADALPVDDRAVDGVFFSFSLHHVPASLYPAAFDEVARVLKPGGFLCVIEPTHGGAHDVVELFHDESREWDAAQQAVRELAIPRFEQHDAFAYHSPVDYGSFDAFVKRYCSRTYNESYTEADVRRPEVEATFERLGAPDYVFRSHKLMVLLRGFET